MPNPYALYVDLSDTSVGNPGTDQGWRIILRTRVKSGFPDPLIFRYQLTSASEVLFSGVSSPADLADFGPAPTGASQFFRSDQCLLDFASQSEAYKIRDDILAQLTQLCIEMARIANNIGPTGTVTVSSEVL